MKLDIEDLKRIQEEIEEIETINYENSLYCCHEDAGDRV